MAKRSTGQPYNELTVSSWREFVDLVSSSALEGWAFRGQERAEWPLFSALSRYLLNFVPDRKLWEERERRSIRIFSRKAHHFIFHRDELEQLFMCVAHMQHHGAPTRLLDFTKSPFVAAFFALERATGEAAVWAVNAYALHQGVRLKSRSARYGSRDAIDPRAGDNFARYFLSNRARFIWVGEPYKMNLRLIAQSGTFVVPGVLDQPVESILSGYPRPKELLLKIVLPASLLRQQGMAALYRMNITHASLFPDLDGLARSQAYELEIEWRGLQQVPAKDTPPDQLN
jgi:FRG domain